MMMMMIGLEGWRQNLLLSDSHENYLYMYLYVYVELVKALASSRLLLIIILLSFLFTYFPMRPPTWARALV